MSSVGQNAFQMFTQAFQALPVAYVINKRVMVMHGGLPMVDGVVLDDIRKLNRSCEPGEQGLNARATAWILIIH